MRRSIRRLAPFVPNAVASATSREAPGGWAIRDIRARNVRRVLWFSTRPPSRGRAARAILRLFVPLRVPPRSRLPQGILQHGHLREVHRLVAHGARSSLRLHREPQTQTRCTAIASSDTSPTPPDAPSSRSRRTWGYPLARVARHLRLRSSRPAVRTRGRLLLRLGLVRLAHDALIFRRYASAICERSSGEPMSFCANSSVRFMPARTHSMTVEVRMGTTCAGTWRCSERRARPRGALVILPPHQALHQHVNAAATADASAPRAAASPPRSIPCASRTAARARSCSCPSPAPASRRARRCERRRRNPATRGAT